jgi:hypothetical protein
MNLVTVRRVKILYKAVSGKVAASSKEVPVKRVQALTREECRRTA